jgi:methyl-accepting chemotaxis protein
MAQRGRIPEPNGPFGAGEGARLPASYPATIPSAAHVLVAVGGMLVLLALAVVIAVVLLLNLRDATRLADRNVEYATDLQAAALLAKTLANDERGFLLSGDRLFERQFREGTPPAREAFERAELSAVGNAQRRALYEARTIFEQWIDLVRTEMAIFRAGDRERAVRTSLGRTRDVRHVYEAHLERGQALADSAVESSTRSLSAASWRSTRILLIYLVIALALGFLLTVWLVRTVLRPVSTLMQLLPEREREARGEIRRAG